MNHRRGTSRCRRGPASARRGRGGKHAAQALAAGAAIATGTQAYGEPILFLNPDGADRFDWAGDGSADSWLDITQPWYDQPGTPGGLSSVNQEAFAWLGQLAGAPAAVAFHTGGADGAYLAPVVAEPYGGDPAEFTSWRSYGLSFYEGYGSLLPEGQDVYVGLRFDLGDGYRYGWIGVVRDGPVLDAFAWGYETEPGILPYSPATPEPGTLSLLAFGAVAATARRRRGEAS